MISTYPQPLTARLMPAALLVGYATLIGLTAAREAWIAFVALTALPIVWLFPVEASLGLFAFLVPFDTVAAIVQGGSGPGTTLNWYVGAISGLMLLVTGLRRRCLGRPPRAALWWTLLVLWASLTTLWAVDTNAAFQKIPSVVSLLLLYLAATSFRITRRELALVNHLAMLGGTSAAIYTIVEFWNGVGWGARASLFLGERATDPNMLAASLILPMALAIQGFLSSRTRLGRAIMGGSFVVMGLSLFLVMSRGGLIAAFVMIFVFLYRTRIDRRTIAILGIFALLIFAAPDLLFVRIGQALESRAQGRFDIWRAGLVVVQHYGLQGAGLENFRVAYWHYAGSAPVFRGYNRESHNTFLCVTGELGVVGLVVFTAALVSQLRFARDRTTTGSIPGALAHEAACWGILASALSWDLLWLKLFWIVFMLSGVGLRVQDEPALLPL